MLLQKLKPHTNNSFAILRMALRSKIRQVNHGNHIFLYKHTNSLCSWVCVFQILDTFHEWIVSWLPWKQGVKECVFNCSNKQPKNIHKSLAHTAKKRCRRAQGKQLHFQKKKIYFRKLVPISGTWDDFLLNVANYTTSLAIADWYLISSSQGGVWKPLYDKCKLVIYVLQLAPNAISWLRTSRPPNNNLKDKNLAESLVTPGKLSTLRRPTLLNSENLNLKKIL